MQQLDKVSTIENKKWEGLITGNYNNNTKEISSKGYIKKRRSKKIGKKSSRKYVDVKKRF